MSDLETTDGAAESGQPAGTEPTAVRRSLAGRSREEGGPVALRAHYAKLGARSLGLLKEAVESLREADRAVSLDAIHVRSVLLVAARAEKARAEGREPENERPIAVSTVLNNEECRRFYYANRSVAPLEEPPAPAARQADRRRSKRQLSHALRKEQAEKRQLRADIASLGAVRARADRERLDGGAGLGPDEDEAN